MIKEKVSILNGITKYQVGGSNPRNVSYLNMKEHGEMYAINSVPPNIDNFKKISRQLILEAHHWVSEIKNGLIITDHFNQIFDLLLQYSIKNEMDEKSIRKLAKSIYKRITVVIFSNEEIRIVRNKFNEDLEDTIKNIKYFTDEKSA